MKLNELFLEQLDNEAKSTRRVLERVPEGRNDWKPHEKSTSFGYLAALVAKMPAWIAMMVDRDEYELTSQDPRFQPLDAKTNVELLRTFDEAVAIGRQALQKASDEHLRKNWKFVVNGQVASESPRYVALRDSMFSHWAHHRGQLTVYLRLNEAVVPAIYGPSADERGF
jgi:uncharacterized damage-inducible protein DinB